MNALSVNYNRKNVWSIFSIVIFGFVVNIVVNAIFDYKYQRALVSFSLEETINAIIVSAFILIGVRWIYRKLEEYQSYRGFSLRNVCIKLAIYLLYTLLILNGLLLLTSALFYGFFSFDEMIVMNVATVIVGLPLVCIDVVMRSYETASKPSEIEISLQVRAGKKTHLLKVKDIRVACLRDNLLYLFDHTGEKYYGNESINGLYETLGEENFFQLNRSTIAHFNNVKSVSKDSYGKLSVTIEAADHSFFQVSVSRLKAAKFSQWIKENHRLASK